MRKKTKKPAPRRSACSRELSARAKKQRRTKRGTFAKGKKR